MSFTPITLRGHLTNAITRRPSTGRLELIPSAPIITDVVGDEVMVSKGVIYPDGEGRFELKGLPPSDDPNLLPGGHGFTLQGRLDGQRIEPFSFYLNLAEAVEDEVTGEMVIDLADVTPTVLVPFQADAETTSGATAKANAALVAAKAYVDERLAEFEAPAGELDTEAVLALIANYLAENDYRPIVTVNEGDDDPEVEQGTVLARLDGAAPVTKSYRLVGEGVNASQTGSHSITLDENTSDVLVVIAFNDVTSTVAASTPANYPSVSGDGRTWTKVTDSDQRTTNGQIAANMWIGVRDPGQSANYGTPVSITAASGQRVGGKVVAVAGWNGTVVEYQESGSVSTQNPVIGLDDLAEANVAIAYMIVNGNSLTIEQGAGEWDELGNRISGSGGNTFSLVAQAQVADATPDLTAGWATGATNQRLLAALEV